MRRLPLTLALWLCAPLLAAPPTAPLSPSGPFDQAQCVACHGARSPEVHSYSTSKHGVLAQISRPGRAPDCVGCHTSQPHPAPPLQPGEAAARPAAPSQGCIHCHSPRYLQKLQANGRRMVALGQMKLREAEGLLQRARGEFTAASLDAMEGHYARMQRHQTNLRLGVAHQSPDYQWWHGHPALDGDLLRIKGAYDRLRQQHSQAPEPAALP